jgi:hypothetical protein
MQTVKDLSIEEVKTLIGEVVEEKIREILFDPDADLALRPEIRQRLLRDLDHPQREGEYIPAAELARRRGLEWWMYQVEFRPRFECARDTCGCA